MGDEARRGDGELEFMHDRRGDLLYRLGLTGLALALPAAVLLVMASQSFVPAFFFPVLAFLIVILIAVVFFVPSGFQSLARTSCGLRVGTIELTEEQLVWARLTGHRHHGIVHLSFVTEGELRRARVLADPARFDELGDIVANVREAALARVREGELDLPTTTDKELRAFRFVLYGQALTGAAVAVAIVAVPNGWTTALAAGFTLLTLGVPLRLWSAVVKLGWLIAIVALGTQASLVLAAIIAGAAVHAARVAWRARVGVLTARGVRVGDEIVPWRDLTLLPIGFGAAIPVPATTLPALVIEAVSAYVRGAPAARFAERDLLAELRIESAAGT